MNKQKIITTLIILNLLLFSLTLQVSGNPRVDPPSPGWSEYNGNYYRYFDTALNWGQAQTAAENAWEEAHLATIRSDGENTFVFSLITQNAWLGGQKITIDETWYWITGEAWDYIPSSTKFNDPFETGLLLNTDGSWSDRDVTATQHYIAEVDASSISEFPSMATSIMVTINLLGIGLLFSVLKQQKTTR